AIPRGAYTTFAGALGGLETFAVNSGAIWPLRDARPPPHVRQVWFAERGRYRTDMFLEAGGDRTPGLQPDERSPPPLRPAVGRTEDGIPYLRPECVLLYKARDPRPKDEADFAAIVPELDDGSRRWLAGALATAHPTHRWLATLDAVPAGGSRLRHAHGR